MMVDLYKARLSSISFRNGFFVKVRFAFVKVVCGYTDVKLNAANVNSYFGK